MLNTLKRKIALGAVAAVGAAGLVTIAAPAANAAAITTFSVAVYPQRAITGSASTITADVTTLGNETGTIRGVITSAPAAATADSSSAIVAGDTLTATAIDWSINGSGATFTASNSAGSSPKSFNSSGAYGVNWYFDRNGNALIDADEPFLVSSFTIGGKPTSLSLVSSALTVAGTGAKSFGVIVKDSTGAATALLASSSERITVLGSVSSTLVDSMTISPQEASASNMTGRAVKAKGFPNTTNTIVSEIKPGDSTTVTTGAYALKANFDAATSAGVGTIVFNLGGSLTPTTSVSGTLTVSAAAFATSIAIANTVGITATNGSNKPSGTAASTTGKYVAPTVMDTGTGTAYAVQANATSASTLSFNIVGTAGAIINVTASGTNVTTATSTVTLDASGKATFTVTPTTAAGTVTVTTPIKDATGTAQNTGYIATYTASSVSGAAAATLGANGITSTPDLSSVTSMIVKTASTNTVKVNVKDQYGVAKQYYAVTGTLSATSRNVGATITQQFTDANGDATISLTDASTSTTALSDVLTIQVTAPGSAQPLLSASNALTITYSSTGAYASLAITGGSTSTTAVSKAVWQADASDQFVTLQPALKDAAASSISGVALTYTGSTGVKFRAASGARTTGGDLGTITAGSGTAVFAYGTTPGTATVTVAGGGLTATATFTVSAIAATATARNIALTAAGNKFTAVVTDGWGNAVPGVTVSLATTSQGIFGGGVTSTSAVTDAAGSATAVVTSADGKAGAVTVSATVATASTQVASLAATPVTDFVAGVASATATGAVVASAAVSGDAATAAAQKATDAKIADIATAVTNLSTTVAGLVASLVAQIKDTKAAITATQTALTALAAVVNKIKAKVKA